MMYHSMIHCTRLTKDQMFYRCDHCSKYRFKNGRPRKRPKIVEHIHGNATGTFENRVEDRVSHCPSGGPRSAEIHITDETERLY